MRKPLNLFKIIQPVKVVFSFVKLNKSTHKGVFLCLKPFLN
nr:MAG TPA: hypothetical protein [Caudoviricetes sp.]